MTTARNNPAKFKRCVRDVEARGGVDNAYAVCQASLYGHKRNPSFAVVNKSGEYFAGFQSGEPLFVKDIDNAVLWENRDHAEAQASLLFHSGSPVQKTPVRRNPADESAAMYSSFHGAPSRETVEVEETEHYHGNLAELGVLVEMGIETVTGKEVWLSFGSGEGDGEENPSIIGTVRKFIEGSHVMDGSSTVTPLTYYHAARKVRDALRIKNYNERLGAIKRELKNYHVMVSPGLDDSIRLYKPDGNSELFIGGKKTNPIWPFGPGQLLGSHEYHYTVRGKGPRTRTGKTRTAAMYKGYRIIPTQFGFAVPEIDPESSWDSMAIAKRAIDDAITGTGKNPRALKKLHYSPLHTNASLNRDAAIRAFEAGMKPEDIAHACPKVFYMKDGKLGQHYDSEIADGSGRLETRYRITDASVKQEIEKFKRRTQHNPGPISSATKFGGQLINDLDTRLGRAIGFHSNPGPTIDDDPVWMALYRQAQASDNAYQNALEREYGKRAGDIRYAHAKQTTAIRKLGEKFRRDSDELRRYVEAARSGSRHHNPSTPESYTDLAYGSQFFKKGNQWFYKLSFRAPGGPQDGNTFGPSEKADSEMSATIERMIKSGKIVKQRTNPSTPDAVSTSTVLLCSNEVGTQLYLVGGDQSLDLDALKFSELEQSKECLIIGEVFFVSYFTRKDFDNFEPIVYEHELGEETGVLPALVYDRVNQHMKLAGGEYHIERPLLETSPGIEN